MHATKIETEDESSDNFSFFRENFLHFLLIFFFSRDTIDTLDEEFREKLVILTYIIIVPGWTRKTLKPTEENVSSTKPKKQKSSQTLAKKAPRTRRVGKFLVNFLSILSAFVLVARQDTSELCENGNLFANRRRRQILSKKCRNLWKLFNYTRYCVEKFHIIFISGFHLYFWWSFVEVSYPTSRNVSRKRKHNMRERWRQIMREENGKKYLSEKYFLQNEKSDQANKKNENFSLQFSKSFLLSHLISHIH